MNLILECCVAGILILFAMAVFMFLLGVVIPISEFFGAKLEAWLKRHL